MDDQVGQQIFLALAGSSWNCRASEYATGESPVLRGAVLCRVLRRNLPTEIGGEPPPRAHATRNAESLPLQGISPASRLKRAAS